MRAHTVCLCAAAAVFGFHALGCGPWEGRPPLRWSELRPHPPCCQPSALQVAAVCCQGRWGGHPVPPPLVGDVGAEALCLLSAVTLNSSVPSASRWLINLAGQGLSELHFCGAVGPP